MRYSTLLFYTIEAYLSGLCGMEEKLFCFTVGCMLLMFFGENPLKVVGNEKVGGSGMCHSVPIWLRPRRSRFISLSISPSSLI